MIQYIIIAILLILLIGAVFKILLLQKQMNDKQEEKKFFVPSDDIKLEVSLRDVIHLADASCILGLEDLMVENEIERRLPSFYQKYLECIKEVKEKYFKTLLGVLSRDPESYYNNLLNTYPEVTIQDVLLLLLSHAGLDNKTCARVLFLNFETLKKRKTRLKTKIEGLLERDKSANFSYCE